MDAAPTPKDNRSPEDSASAEYTLDNERKDTIKKHLGSLSLVLNEMDQTDRSNAINEAAEQKMKQKGFFNSLAKTPVVSLVVKPLLAAYYRTKASGAVAKTGKLSSAAASLDLENFQSRIAAGDGAEDNRARARLALEDAGFPEEGSSISSEDSVALNKGESIEKIAVKDEEKAKIKGALTDLLADLKSAKTDEERKAAEEKFDSQIDAWQAEGMFAQGAQGGILNSPVMRYLIGDHTKQHITVLDGIKDAKAGIKQLAEEDISKQDLNAYLDENLSLYRASMKEGVYTKQKVNSILEAVAKGGAVGAIAYTVLGYQSRVGARAALGGSIGVGAALGGIFGAARGARQASIKISESEIKHATDGSDAEAPAEPEEASPESEESQASESSAEGEEQPQEESESESESESTESESGKPEGLNAAEQKSFRGLLAKINSAANSAKRKATGEDKYLKAIEAARKRKSSAEIMDNLNELNHQLSEPEADADLAELKDKLVEAYADAIARHRLNRI